MITPAGHRILVKPDEISEVTEGGIIRPDMNIDYEKTQMVSGTIEAIGAQAWLAFYDGKPWAKVGDRVVYAKYGGVAVEDEGVQYRVLNDEDIMAIKQED